MSLYAFALPSVHDWCVEANNDDLNLCISKICIISWQNSLKAVSTTQCDKTNSHGRQGEREREKVSISGKR